MRESTFHSENKSLSFDSLLDEIKSRSIEEKEELKFLVERLLTEERRVEINQDYQKSRLEFSQGSLEFSSDIRQLKKTMEE